MPTVRHLDQATALLVIEQHEERARGELQAASGGAPLCGTDGRPRPVKGLEGAAVALADVRRAVRRQPADAGREAVARALASVRSTWQGVLDADPSGPGWRVYAEGGLRAIDDLDQDLAAPARDAEEPTGQATEQPAPVPGLPALFSTRLRGDALAPARGDAERPGTSSAPAVAGGWQAALARRWPPRRLLAAAGLLVLALVALAAGPGWPAPGAGWWNVSTLGVAAFASLTLATFVPARGSGQVVDVGCTPCATMAGVVSVGAVLYLATAPVDQGSGLLALAATGFALVKRLTDPEVCPR